jgi:hypothetical protein
MTSVRTPSGQCCQWSHRKTDLKPSPRLPLWNESSDASVGKDDSRFVIGRRQPRAASPS